MFLTKLLYRLIAIGLDEFTDFVISNDQNPRQYSLQNSNFQILQYLSHYLVPTKDPDQLKIFIRKERKKADSPIRVSVFSFFPLFFQTEFYKFDNFSSLFTNYLSRINGVVNVGSNYQQNKRYLRFVL